VAQDSARGLASSGLGEQQCWLKVKVQDMTAEAAMSCPCPDTIDVFGQASARNRGEN
jgi:hypothetical protein